MSLINEPEHPDTQYEPKRKSCYGLYGCLEGHATFKECLEYDEANGAEYDKYYTRQYHNEYENSIY